MIRFGTSGWRSVLTVVRIFADSASEEETGGLPDVARRCVLEG